MKQSYQNIIDITDAHAKNILLLDLLDYTNNKGVVYSSEEKYKGGAKIMGLTMSEVVEFLEEHGGTTENHDIERNGWQCDMWQSIDMPNGKTYSISTSGYYGGIQFYEDEV